MRFGVIASVLLHLAIVGAGFLAPNFIKLPDVAPEPYIPLDLIREAELDLKTSVPAASPKPVVEEQPEPDIPKPVVEEQPAPVEEKPAEKLPEPEPAPVVKEPEPKPEPKKPEPKPEPKKPEPPKPAPVKKPEPKKDELDLDALEKALVDLDPKKNNAQPPREAPSQTTQEADRARAAVGAGDRLTASDKAKMIAAIARCYNTSSLIGAPNPETLLVVLQFELNRDGTLMTQPRVANSLQINFSNNRFWKVAEQASIRAVVACQPYDFLDQARYEDWKEFEVGMRPMQ